MKAVNNIADILIQYHNTLLLMEFHQRDRKSTRLNSSHSQISYAVFCLKKKTHCAKIPKQRRLSVWPRQIRETLRGSTLLSPGAHPCSASPPTFTTDRSLRNASARCRIV